MTIKEHIIEEIDKLDEKQLTELEEFVTFLKFRSHYFTTPIFDNEKICKLYEKFAEEDRLLAEEGMDDYAAGLSKEDEQ